MSRTSSALSVVTCSTRVAGCRVRSPSSSRVLRAWRMVARETPRSSATASSVTALPGRSVPPRIRSRRTAALLSATVSRWILVMYLARSLNLPRLLLARSAGRQRSVPHGAVEQPIRPERAEQLLRHTVDFFRHEVAEQWGERDPAVRRDNVEPGCRRQRAGNGAPVRRNGSLADTQLADGGGAGVPEHAGETAEQLLRHG